MSSSEQSSPVALDILLVEDDGQLSDEVQDDPVRELISESLKGCQRVPVTGQVCPDLNPSLAVLLMVRVVDGGR